MSKHAALAGYLMEELGEFLVPDWLGNSVTPNDIWQLQREAGQETGARRIIVTYAETTSSDFNNLLWPAVQHVWGNAKTQDRLQSFLDGMMSRRPVFCRWSFLLGFLSFRNIRLHICTALKDFFLQRRNYVPSRHMAKSGNKQFGQNRHHVQ